MDNNDIVTVRITLDNIHKLPSGQLVRYSYPNKPSMRIEEIHDAPATDGDGGEK